MNFPDIDVKVDFKEFEIKKTVFQTLQRILLISLSNYMNIANEFGIVKVIIFSATSK